MFVSHPSGPTKAALLAAVAITLAAASAARAEPRPADLELVAQVKRQLLANLETPFDFPDDLVKVVDAPDVNAFAHINDQGKPEVVIYTGLLTKAIDGHADRLALIMGHEMGHIVLGHVKRDPQKTKFAELEVTREQEYAADAFGMKLAMRAGYSYPAAREIWTRMNDLKLDYNSFEGLSVNHPSWSDRLAAMDKEKSELWSAMSAFRNGAYFMAAEDYEVAEKCFDAVTKSFPECPEAWANLGAARLMRYMDALDSSNLQQLGVSQVVVGAFYERSEYLQNQTRGIDQDLWWSAVGALQKSLEVKPDQPLAKANLGVAYLVRPGGPDIGHATKFLNEAAEAAQAADGMDLSTQAAILLNTSVASFADGDKDAGLQRLDAADSLGRRFAGDRPRLDQPLFAALLYNQAVAASTDPDKRGAAIKMFERYLSATDPKSAWWPLAYDRYAGVCKDAGAAPKEKDDLAKRDASHVRMVVSLPLADGRAVALGDPEGQSDKALGEPEISPVVPDSNIRRRAYAKHGIVLLTAGKVLAICLESPDAPPVQVRGTGLGSKPIELRVGMSRDQVKEILDDSDFRFVQLTDPELSYRYYPALGLAVRMDKQGVRELVIVQVPEATMN